MWIILKQTRKQCTNQFNCPRMWQAGLQPVSSGMWQHFVHSIKAGDCRAICTKPWFLQLAVSLNHAFPPSIQFTANPFVNWHSDTSVTIKQFILWPQPVLCLFHPTSIHTHTHFHSEAHSAFLREGCRGPMHFSSSSFPMVGGGCYDLQISSTLEKDISANSDKQAIIS